MARPLVMCAKTCSRICDKMITRYVGKASVHARGFPIVDGSGAEELHCCCKLYERLAHSELLAYRGVGHAFGGAFSCLYEYKEG
jgi:hypothetical protein